MVRVHVTSTAFLRFYVYVDRVVAMRVVFGGLRVAGFSRPFVGR